MLYPIDQLKTVSINTLPVGTFVRVMGHPGDAPLLGVVVQFDDPARLGVFALEGPNAYGLVASISSLHGYVCSNPGSNRSIEIHEPETTTKNYYDIGKLAIADDGAFITGKSGPNWQTSILYVDMNTWTAKHSLGDFADPVCFDRWKIIAIDSFGGKQTIFSAEPAAQK